MVDGIVPGVFAVRRLEEVVDEIAAEHHDAQKPGDNRRGGHPGQEQEDEASNNQTNQRLEQKRSPGGEVATRKSADAAKHDHGQRCSKKGKGDGRPSESVTEGCNAGSTPATDQIGENDSAEDGHALVVGRVEHLRDDQHTERSDNETPECKSTGDARTIIGADRGRYHIERKQKTNLAEKRDVG